MFPVYVKVRNAAELKKVYDLLGDGDAVEGVEGAPPAAPAAPVKAPAKVKAVKEAAAPAAAPVLSAEGLAFLQSHLKDPVTALSMKDEPKMKAICAKYGVERVSLIPEALFPQVLQEVLDALDPAAAERKRLEAIDAAKEGAKPARSLL